MNRPNWAVLSGVLLIFGAALAGADLMKGGFYIGKHEGDTLHLLEIVFRMQDGARPHFDFVTPIGALAFLPIVALLKAGLGAGTAMLVAQGLVALVLLPAIIWVAGSRYRGAWAYAFGALVLVLVLALIYGEAERAVSISMHYNRWSWALAFLVLSVAVIERGRAPVPDGLVMGLGLGALALIKVTFFVAFAPAVAVALIARRDWAALGWTVGAGLAVALWATLAWGPVFWLAYLGDLLAVSRSEIRPNAGLDLASLLGSPPYLLGNLLGFAAVILLRKSGPVQARAGMVLLFILPGALYVTYQNYGNDPKWWALIGLMLLMLRPEPAEGEKDSRAPGLFAVGVALLALAAPSFTNLAYSPFRHLTVDTETYTPLLPASGASEDLQVPRIRAFRFDVKQAADGPGQPFARWADRSLRDEPDMLAGEALPECNLELGTVGWFTAMAEGLREAGVRPDETVLATDLLSSFWLYGAGRPLKGAAPWYYGGLTGLDDADYILVPLCPIAGKVRHVMLGELKEAGVTLTEIARNDIFILLTPGD